MLRSLVLIASVLMLSLSACSDPLVGKGPIKLSSKTELGFEEYQSEFKPGHFAVAVDGRAYSYSYCRGRCRKNSKQHSIYQCEKQSGGIPCKIYGSKGNVVWDREAEADG